MKTCVFTICAKNYLARALTLKGSFIRNNESVDFYIFLSDLDTEKLVDNIPQLILIGDTIVPNWKEMAFKYNVIEYSTAIKPFCINYLFDERNYEKVIYLDPDIYVYSSLDIIFNWLDKKDMVVTPHYNNIAVNYSGAETEEELLYVGIYNLGFCAIRKSEIGVKIVNWWMNRLESKCYADKNNALHVDQRWIDFLPAFFPDNILITRHPGMNVAIWNLHERELIKSDDNFFVKDLVTNEIDNLLFFHFAGFNPNNKDITVIHRSFPQYNTDVYPSFKVLLDDYRVELLNNRYDYYSQMKYSFNFFSNGKKILPVNRRLFRVMVTEGSYSDIFENADKLYAVYKKNKLISKYDDKMEITDIITEPNKKVRLMKIIHAGFKILLFVLGIDKYCHLLAVLNRVMQLENQTFLMSTGGNNRR